MTHKSDVQVEDVSKIRVFEVIREESVIQGCESENCERAEADKAEACLELQQARWSNEVEALRI